MQTVIFDKTDKGRDEIITRKYRLANRLRTLLVMVDGKSTQEELLKRVAGLGLNKADFDGLVDDGFIQDPSARHKPKQDDSTPSHPTMTPAQLFQLLADFYTQAIQENLGLRGHALQLQVDQSTTLQEFLIFRSPFLDAIKKIKGEQKVLVLRQQLDDILNIIPTQFRSQP